MPDRPTHPLASFAADGPGASDALGAFVSGLAVPPAVVVLAMTEELDVAAAMGQVTQAAGPACRVIATTSAGGIFTEQGLVRGPALGALCWAADDAVEVGTACGARTPGESPRALAARVADAACADADRPGEVPDLVVMVSTPGCEEDLLAGVADALGPSVPVVGGSAADEDLRGAWRVGSGGRVIEDGVAVLVLFAEAPPRVVHQSGYLPTEKKALVTHAEGRRIWTLDGQPAATVYDAWTDGLLSRCRAEGRSVLHATTLFPLGRTVARVADQPIYALAHPAIDVGDGSIELFADVEAGNEVVLMQGSPEALVARAGRVARDAVATGSTAGGLMIYCAGCSLGVGERLPEVPPQVAAAFGGRPVLGWFTYGEQGPRRGDHHNQHANLMITAVAVPDRP